MTLIVSACLHCYVLYIAVFASTPENPISVEVHSVDVGSQESVLLPEFTPLILDCLPYANRTFGAQANLSSIQWFRIPTEYVERTYRNLTEIIDNSTFFQIRLYGNKEKLFIEEVTIATGAQEGTEAAYRCKVCRNSMPPDPLSCAEATTTIDAYSE